MGTKCRNRPRAAKTSSKDPARGFGGKTLGVSGQHSDLFRCDGPANAHKSLRRPMSRFPPFPMPVFDAHCFLVLSFLRSYSAFHDG